MSDMFDGASDEELNSRMSELHKDISAVRSEINGRRQAAAQTAFEHLKEAQLAYAAVVGAPAAQATLADFNLNKYTGMYGWRTL